MAHAHAQALKAARQSRDTFMRTFQMANRPALAQSALGETRDSIGVRSIVDEELVRAMENPEVRHSFFRSVLEGSSLAAAAAAATGTDQSNAEQLTLVVRGSWGALLNPGGKLVRALHPHFSEQSQRQGPP